MFQPWYVSQNCTKGGWSTRRPATGPYTGSGMMSAGMLASWAMRTPGVFSSGVSIAGDVLTVMVPGGPGSSWAAAGGRTASIAKTSSATLTGRGRREDAADELRKRDDRIRVTPGATGGFHDEERRRCGKEEGRFDSFGGGLVVSARG